MNIKIKQDDINIEKLIQTAKQEQIWIPGFQRSFIWDKCQVSLLMDDVIDGYRCYYNKYKQHLFTWKNRSILNWIAISLLSVLW